MQMLQGRAKTYLHRLHSFATTRQHCRNKLVFQIYEIDGMPILVFKGERF